MFKINRFFFYYLLVPRWLEFPIINWNKIYLSSGSALFFICLNKCSSFHWISFFAKSSISFQETTRFYQRLNRIHWLKIDVMNCGLPCLPLKYWVDEVKILIAQCCLAWKSEYEYHPYKRLFIQTFLYSTLCDLWQKYTKTFAVVKTWKYYSEFFLKQLKGYVCYIFASLFFLCVKDSTCERRKIAF